MSQELTPSVLPAVEFVAYPSLIRKYSLRNDRRSASRSNRYGYGLTRSERPVTTSAKQSGHQQGRLGPGALFIIWHT
jgi:hypothetical protein